MILCDKETSYDVFSYKALFSNINDMHGLTSGSGQFSIINRINGPTKLRLHNA